MIFFRIKADNEENLNKIARTLKESRTFARRVDGCLIAATGNDHTTHVTNIASRFNGDSTQLKREDVKGLFPTLRCLPKREYVAFDGTVFSDRVLFAQYERNNNPKNVEAIKQGYAKRLNTIKERKPRASKSEVVARLAPNQPMTVDGAIASFEELENKLLSAYNEVTEAKQILTKYNEFKKLLESKNEYKNAIKMILAAED